MRKHIVKRKINLIILTFDKFIINVHKKEKRLRSRNYNVLVNAKISIKYCLNNKK